MNEFEREPEVCEERWRDDVAAFAIGALGTGEAEQLQAHLAECPRCAERLRWLQPAVDLLPASIPQLDPPAELRERLMAIVRDEAAAPAAAAEPAGVLAWLRGLSGGFAMRPALATAFAAVVIAAGVGGYELRGDPDPGQGARTVNILPATPRIDAAGSVELHGDSAVVRLSHLPQLPRDEVYQAWIRTGETIEPSSVFVPDRDGDSSVGISGDLGAADELMVTREPAGGSQTPQSAVILSAPL